MQPNPPHLPTNSASARPCPAGGVRAALPAVGRAGRGGPRGRSARGGRRERRGAATAGRGRSLCGAVGLVSACIGPTRHANKTYKTYKEHNK